MAYNLIDERWISVERRSGRIDCIAPAEIVDRDDPPLRIATPRPDFDAALLEFLIGLVQSAAAPDTEHSWEKQYERPPEVAALRKRLSQVRDAFLLDGDGPRFMQDLDVHREATRIENPIGALLIDRCGEPEAGGKPELFTKPGGFEQLGLPAAATALFAMQSWAPAGGAGVRTSLRGGGPLTTVIISDDLWSTVWLNVLPLPELLRRVPGNSRLARRGATFPWLEPTRTSESKGGHTTLPEDIHPLQHFWGLPRRVRLDLSTSSGVCSVTGETGIPTAAAFVSRPSGTNYKGAFGHPLTPYGTHTPGEPPSPKKGSADGLPYRDWPLLVAPDEKRAPALVISYFSETRRRELVERPRLGAFGFAMDNMKPLQWCQATTPLITVRPELHSAFSEAVHQLVAASEDVRKTVAGQVKAAWSTRPSDLPGDVYARVNPAFWAHTEASFFQAVEGLRTALEASDAAALQATRERFLTNLHRGALDVFLSFARPDVDAAPPDLRRTIAAHGDVQTFTHPTNARLRQHLGLPVDRPPKPSRRAPAAAASGQSPAAPRATRGKKTTADSNNSRRRKTHE